MTDVTVRLQDAATTLEDLRTLLSEDARLDGVLSGLTSTAMRTVAAATAVSVTVLTDTETAWTCTAADATAVALAQAQYGAGPAEPLRPDGGGLRPDRRGTAAFVHRGCVGRGRQRPALHAGTGRRLPHEGGNGVAGGGRAGRGRARGPARERGGRGRPTAGGRVAGYQHQAPRRRPCPARLAASIGRVLLLSAAERLRRASARTTPAIGESTRRFPGRRGHTAVALG